MLFVFFLLTSDVFFVLGSVPSMFEGFVFEGLLLLNLIFWCFIPLALQRRAFSSPGLVYVRGGFGCFVFVFCRFLGCRLDV